MGYEDERQRILRERMARTGRTVTTTFDPQQQPIAVPPSEFSEVEQFMGRVYEDESLLYTGLIPGVIHDRRGVWEGLDAREIAQRQAIVGLWRASGYNRNLTPNPLSFDRRDNPLGADDNVRVFDKYPIPPGEYYTRPFSMQFDRIAMESALQTADMGFTFFCEYRNSSTIAAGAIFELPGSGVSPDRFNHDYPIERVVVINDSSVDLVMSVDRTGSSTGGPPGTGSGDFLVKPGESNTYPVRAYQLIQITNADGSTAVPANQCRVQLYGYKDAHPLVMARGGGRPMQSDGSGGVIQQTPPEDFSPTLP